MIEWLPVAFLAVAQIVVRVIGVAGMIWQERAHARSNCAQMRTASASGVVLCEIQENGAMLLIAPQHEATRGRSAVAAGPGSEEAPGS